MIGFDQARSTAEAIPRLPELWKLRFSVATRLSSAALLVSGRAPSLNHAKPDTNEPDLTTLPPIEVLHRGLAAAEGETFPKNVTCSLNEVDARNLEYFVCDGSSFNARIWMNVSLK